MLHDIGLGKNLSDKTPKAKSDKWDDLKLQSLCTTKETIDSIKRYPTEYDKIFANYTSDSGLISRIYKELPIFAVRITCSST